MVWRFTVAYIIYGRTLYQLLPYVNIVKFTTECDKAHMIKSYIFKNVNFPTYDEQNVNESGLIKVADDLYTKTEQNGFSYRLMRAHIYCY